METVLYFYLTTDATLTTDGLLSKVFDIYVLI